MVIYDGIIYSLQRRGGITTLFDQLITRMPENSYKLLVYDGYTKINCLSSCVRMKTRFFERYRKANVRNQSKVFHSTYYRLPASEKVPVVTTVHDFSYEKYRKGLAKYVHAEQKYKAISKSDRIICVSESTKNDLS